eukprot:CAMPEP_0119350108 /NCGR_PEP_ID=MMETSP1333-20130426/109891_1 /TAXON_ID=418940 /ORGANISM="Scyphosphaera apsteinii, Strain RCC1455" /LENGTH=334 /DNA_ID=CAMNT_0007362719 /DNA_START=195 /DNA_END=1199 /DNA_ORIENTATION=+
MRDASLEQRKELRATIRQAHNTSDHNEMRIEWCRINPESDLCAMKHKQRMHDTTNRPKESWEQRRASDRKVDSRSEFVAMLEAWCTPEHRDEMPCLANQSPATLMKRRKDISSAEAIAQHDAMYEFWCNDPVKDRDSSGICLRWKLNRDRDLVRRERAAKARSTMLALARNGSNASAARAADLASLEHHGPGDGALHSDDLKQSMEAYRVEMEQLHEWYCTSTRPEIEESVVCMGWRLRMKTLSEEERARYNELQQARLIERRQVMEQLEQARASHDEEATTKAQAELNELREHGRSAFNEMRRAWCEEGEAKDKGDASEVCRRWRLETIKSEL